MRLLALVAVLSLAGCRFEPSADASSTGGAEAPAACDCADGRDVADAPPDTLAPPVAAGDTARVTPDAAGAFDPPVELRPNVSAAGLAIPVAGVEPGDLVDTFQAARSEGRAHDAIDILAPRGTPVVAAADGEVVRLFTSDKGGLTVYHLGADDRTVYYYAHLDAYAPGLRAGQRVRRGQPVGTVGDSGNAVPGNTHLHFAIWRTADPADFWDGEPVNPYPLLVE
ncbi:M23 family metallopeptidase [Rubrivirga sp.]|uniref:M23 family metallopeptidase n=1 Tax=Rubrivirga sp. TaxID=1885344 RepID=UPI003B52F309